MCIRSLATGYCPDPSPLEGGYYDMFGFPLCTLQDFLEGFAADDHFGRTGKAMYVSAAMDPKCALHNRTITVLEIDREYGQHVPVRVCDTGEAFEGKGTSRIDLCCRCGDDPATGAPYMNADLVNGHVTLSLEEEQL